MKKDNNTLLNGFSTATTISCYLISPIVVGLFIGRLADEYFGSQPWATTGGIVLGIIAGMWAMYKKVVGVK